MTATVAQGVAELAARLAAAGVPTPEVDAELLARHVLGWSRAGLLLRGGEPLAPAQAVRLRALGRRRAAREPLQLVLGTVGFRHLELEVQPGVFIPRPETEVLAGEAILRTPLGGVVVEPCTGSGAVACALAHEGEAGEVVATDVDPAAVALARRNARRCGLSVTVRHGDLLAPVRPGLRGRVDVLVCNPPYLTALELGALEPEVRAWDPYRALVSGHTGLELSHRLIEQSPAWLRPGGWLLLEIAEQRAAATLARCRAAGLVDLRALADLAGRDQVVVARRP